MKKRAPNKDEMQLPQMSKKRRTKLNTAETMTRKREPNERELAATTGSEE